MTFTLSSLVLALAATLTGVVNAHPIAQSSSESTISERGSLLSSLGIQSWSQPPEHPVHKLFARQSTYPTGNPDVTTMPDAWKQALSNALAAGLIPDIPQSNEGVYPNGLNPLDPSICSSTAQCRGNGDIWDSPDGMLGISFDDGPTAASPALYDYLRSQNQRSTHFMIGLNIAANQNIFMQTYNDGNDIAVHTWTHRYMTGLTNEELVAEFGWTLQIIADLTGGRIARYWRPPYGDSDNRVRAIAKNIFGLTQVNWNHDTDDWEIATGQTNPTAVANALASFIALPKSPGLMILEHELDTNTVQAFINAYPNMKSSGWDTRSIPELFGAPYYQNAQGNTSPVTPQGVVAGSPAAGPAAAAAAGNAVTTGANPTPANATPTSAIAMGASVSPSSSASVHKNGATPSIRGVTGYLWALLVLPFLL